MRGLIHCRLCCGLPQVLQAFGNDLDISIGRVCIAATCIFSYPLLQFIARGVIEDLLFRYAHSVNCCLGGDSSLTVCACVRVQQARAQQLANGNRDNPLVGSDTRCGNTNPEDFGTETSALWHCAAAKWQPLTVNPGCRLSSGLQEVQLP